MRILFAILIILTAFTGYSQSSEDAGNFREIEEIVEVDLYPNPASDQINIRIADNKDIDLKFELHNIIGNQITINPEEVAPGQYRISIEDLTPGYYLLSVREEGKAKGKVHKFLKR